jgi:hypothetical protein
VHVLNIEAYLVDQLVRTATTTSWVNTNDYLINKIITRKVRPNGKNANYFSCWF